MNFELCTTKSQLESEYWDKNWRDKITGPQTVEMNAEKMNFLMGQMLARPGFDDKYKLDIGCGTGIHAIQMRKVNPGWVDRWTGIDMSQVAVDWGKKFGLDIVCGDIFTHDFVPHQFGAFLLLDSLEHIDDHEALAGRLKEIGTEDFVVFGNVPLYRSEHEPDEHLMDANKVKNFLKHCGFKGFNQHIYGAGALPYMMFEGIR